MRSGGLTLAVSSALQEPDNRGERKLSPKLFLGIIALATVPADAYEDSRATLS